MASAPGQLCTSTLLLRVYIDRRRGNGLAEPYELGSKIFNLLLDIFEFLQQSASAVRDNHSPDQYLIMLDECGHPVEDGLEGRETIGGLFRNIEEYLHDPRNSLLLC